MTVTSEHLPEHDFPFALPDTGADRARCNKGCVDGRHFTEHADDVKRLKRVGDLDGAEQLLNRLIDAVEAEAHEMRWGVAPWYYHQLAIVLRKKGDNTGELDVLERYERQVKAPGSRPSLLNDRLAKLRARIARLSGHRTAGRHRAIVSQKKQPQRLVIGDWRLRDTPVAVVDFETTGLTAGTDRVVEIAIVRIAPESEPLLILNTMVNPGRSVSASEIHGITDRDVHDAPSFSQIAGDVVDAISGCVVAAYNVYFDIRFLQFELSVAGIAQLPPHMCLMYMRPILGLGDRCRLEQACQALGIDYQTSHAAASDAVASGHLYSRYLLEAHAQGLETFSDLARRKRYKFVESFSRSPLESGQFVGLKKGSRLKPRPHKTPATPTPDARRALLSYWDTLTTVVADLEITNDEVQLMLRERLESNLPEEQIRMLHARVFANAITDFTRDEWLDRDEVSRLKRLHRCLAELGWAPGL